MKSKILLQASIMLFAAFIFQNANAQCVPAGNGTNGGISCMYTDSTHNMMYIGGGFQNSGNDTLNHCGFWNDSTFTHMGMMGNIGVNDSVWCFAHFNGSLYVGGSFTQAGGVNTNHVARWDGTAWHSVGNGLNQSVHALMVYHNELYAGGDFTSSGSTLVSHFGKWDGTQWLQMGGGIDGDVETLCVWQGALYLGGDFTMAGGMTVNNICKWDGTNFSSVGGGMTSGMMGNTMVHSMCVYNGNLMAGGMFEHAGSMDMHNLAMWNGSSWSSVGEIVGAMMGKNEVNTMMAYNGQLFVGGNFSSCGSATANNLGSWNGTSWSTIGTGMNGKVNALAVYHGNLYIAGAFSSAAGTSVNNIAKYSLATGTEPILLDTHSLTAYPNPASDLVHVNWVSEYSSPVTLVVTDITGKIVYQKNPGTLPAGNHQEEISVKDLSKGTYFLTLNSGNKRLSVKLEIAK